MNKGQRQESGVDSKVNKKRYGRCRICQKFGRLTREHVPPQSAFNDRNYLEFYVDQTKQAELLKWEARGVNQRGIYLFTLCERCNNRTGTLYGTDYLNFVKTFTPVANPDHAGNLLEANIKNFFPLRVVKQVISMVLSTSHPGSFGNYSRVGNTLLDTTPLTRPEDIIFNPPDPEHLRSVYEKLRAFVKDKDAKGLPTPTRLYAHAVANEGVGFQTGIAATGRRSTGKTFWLVFAGLWPIHWTFVLDGEIDAELLDVTEWADLGFKDRRNKKVQIPCHWSVGKYPLDFRSPEEFRRDHFAGMMRLEGFSPEAGMDDEQFFRGAVSFARRRGKWTREGYLMTEFTSGTYFEAYGRTGWLEGLTRDEAREFLKQQLAQGGETNS